MPVAPGGLSARMSEAGSVSGREGQSWVRSGLPLPEDPAVLGSRGHVRVTDKAEEVWDGGIQRPRMPPGPVTCG